MKLKAYTGFQKNFTTSEYIHQFMNTINWNKEGFRTIVQSKTSELNISQYWQDINALLFSDYYCCILIQYIINYKSFQSHFGLSFPPISHPLYSTNGNLANNTNTFNYKTEIQSRFL